jgi:LysR family transcriptional regulator, hydrogen peroxide-inducible genes activator
MDDRLPASSMPTLRQLQFLIALRAEGSFVAAAEAVGVTQPTLSAGIKDLENALGVTLVERGRTGAVLTPAGEDAAERAARAMGEVEELVRTVQAAGEPFSGTFRLGAIPTIAPFLLPRALPLLKKKFPRLRLQMREDLTHRLVEQLRVRTLDAALIALPYEAHGVATLPIAEDEFFFLGPEDHPLAKRNDLAPDQLKQEELLLLEDGHCLREHALSACRLSPSKRSSEVGDAAAADRRRSRRHGRRARRHAPVRHTRRRPLNRRRLARTRRARNGSAHAGRCAAGIVLGTRGEGRGIRDEGLGIRD